MEKPLLTRLLGLGRYLFLLSLSLYVFLHFALADFGVKEFVPAYLPFPYFWNYFTGLCILAFMVSGVVGKWDRLAGLLFALYLLLVILLVHLPGAAGDPQDFQNIFRAANMMGGALMYASAFARDQRLPRLKTASNAPAVIR